MLVEATSLLETLQYYNIKSLQILLIKQELSMLATQTNNPQ